MHLNTWYIMYCGYHIFFFINLLFLVYKRVWKGKISMHGNYRLDRKMNHKPKKSFTVSSLQEKGERKLVQ